MPIYKCSKTDDTTRRVMKALFSEFLTQDIINAPVPPMSTSTALQPPLLPDDRISDPTEKTNGVFDEPALRQHGETVAEKNAMEEDALRQTSLVDDVDRYLYGDTRMYS